MIEPNGVYLKTGEYQYELPGMPPRIDDPNSRHAEGVKEEGLPIPETSGSQASVQS